MDSDHILTFNVLFNLRVDYVIAPLKVLQSLKDSPAIPDDEKYSFVRKLTPETATHYHFTNKEVSSEANQHSFTSGFTKPVSHPVCLILV